MALVANFVVARLEITRPGVVGVALVALLALNYAIPIGRITFESRALESLFYAVAGRHDRIVVGPLGPAPTESLPNRLSATQGRPVRAA